MYDVLIRCPVMMCETEAQIVFCAKMDVAQKEAMKELVTSS